MNLKHIKVALKCIPIYKLLRHFRLLPLFSSSLVQCTVLETCGCIERSVDTCAQVVSCHLVWLLWIRCYWNVETFALAELQLAQRKERGVSLHVARCRHRVYGGWQGRASFACPIKMALCCAACLIWRKTQAGLCVEHYRRLKGAWSLGRHRESWTQLPNIQTFMSSYFTSPCGFVQRSSCLYSEGSKTHQAFLLRH